MGVHFDCDNSFLYVSTVAGSSIKEEVGNIFQVDISGKKIIDSLENTDAIGLATFNTVEGKRLYFGLARKSEVHSVRLDKNGKFSGKSRFEFSLLDQPGGADDKAHKITFKDSRMEVKANEFTYTLAAASDPEFNIYSFKYNRKTDKWDFRKVRKLE